MQYIITLPQSVSDTAAFADRLEAEDPSALIDRAPDAPELRLSTCLTHGELHALADAVGLAVGANAIRQLPSECCGGCGG